MARRDDDPGQPQEEMDDAEGSETEDESEGAKGKVAVKSKGKSRRKASEKPEGSDQKRQAFSKRKRGLILKSYQLYKLTDARVFVFIVNDKGSSWAYASPGFARTLTNQHLLQMREYAQLSGNQRLSTEIMPHPHTDAEDRRIDDRPQVIRANLGPGEAIGAGPGPGGAVPSPAGAVRNPSSSGASQQQQQMLDMPPPPSSVGAGSMPTALMGSINLSGAAPRRAAEQGAGDGRDGLAGSNSNQHNNKNGFRLHLDTDDPMEEEVVRDVAPAGPGGGGGGRGAFLGVGPDSIITPSGRRMAAAVGIALPAEAGGDGGFRDEMDRDMGPPGPRAGGGGGRGMGPGERGGGFQGAMGGLPQDIKQTRNRDGCLEGGPPGSGGGAAPGGGGGGASAGRGRRPDLQPSGPAQQQRRGQEPSGVGSGAPEAGGHMAYSQQQQQPDPPASMADDDQRHMQRGGRPPLQQQQQQPTVTTTSQQQLQQQQRQPPCSLGSVPAPYATGYVLPGAFSYGQVVQGSDGQLYRVVRELDDGEAQVVDEPITIFDEGAARVLMAMP